jgi:hypothetical protein
MKRGLTRTMEHFRTVLTANNYAPSTIDMYCRRLVKSGVNLQNRRAVHRHLSSKRVDLEGDSQGNDYRAFLLYDRFLRNAMLPGGHDYQKSELTVRDVCLVQNSKEDLARVWWLHAIGGYAPGVAASYVRDAKRAPASDRHGSIFRARCALQRFHIDHVLITDKVVSDYYRKL